MHELSNLVKIVKYSHGELDLAIRDNYLNIYYKGNSLANISRNKQGKYRVKIHRKFFEGTSADSPDFYEEKTTSNNYSTLTLSSRKPPLRFLQKKHITQFSRRAKKVNYGEEIVFEQVLITDNMERSDLIIIDRQVTDKKLRGKRLDLLGLQQLKPENNKYKFLVIEVKLGNNLELKKDVAHQLEGYLTHIKENIADYQRCYEIQYSQKKLIGIFDTSQFEKIEIVNQVEGLVVVGGYSKLADQSIKELKQHSPNIQVQKFQNRI